MLNTYINECQEAIRQQTEKSKAQQLILNLTNNLETSDYCINKIHTLQNKCREPMQIAIIGQFSSGKSTFLNALLGQKILPTGITPITSKVCKICYGEEYILEVIYKDGRRIFQNIEFLQKQTREESINIESFCLYAPILLLKEINFLDTPGFNSQNECDTTTTNKILEEVDGIIWLTLIDNAGKNSEKNILKNTITKYAQKSLCVLNQKDRLKNEQEIQTSLQYAKEAFGNIFAQIIPISAKMALIARLDDDKKIFQDSIISIMHNIQKIEPDSNLIDKIQELISKEKNKIEESKITIEANKNLMEQSGMYMIFEFLDSKIRPKASISKEYSAIKQFREIHVLLKLQYHKIKMCYTNLSSILNNHKNKIERTILSNQKTEQNSFDALYVGLDTLLDTLAHKIFNSLKTDNIEINYTKKGFISSKLESYSKEVTILPREQLQLSLTNVDSQLYKNFKSLSLQIKNFCDLFLQNIQSYSQDLQKQIEAWGEIQVQKQELYKVAPNNTSLENLKTVKNQYYKEMLMPYLKNDLEIASYLKSELTFLSNFISTNYNNMINSILSQMDLKIINAINKHKENQNEFDLFIPTLENIRDTINEVFCFEQFQTKLYGPMNLLKKTNSQFIAQLDIITKTHLENIEKNKNYINQCISKINANISEIRDFENMELKLL